MTKLLDKPARLQVDPDSIPDDDKPPQTGTSFNIWFLKWSGGESSSKNYVNLKFRVNISKDSGTTNASNSRSTPICLFFARGCCYKGPKCNFKHRLPDPTSDYVIPTQDCFGRDKTSDYKDDMDGVGSFNRYNSTLYVAGLNLVKGSKIENSLTKHFQEFGSIEKIRILYDKGCAFITYKTEEEAQFAKEALQAQKLDGTEVLNIRWASEDPNPQAQRMEKRKLEARALETVKNLLHQVDTNDKKRKAIIVQEPNEDGREYVDESVPEPLSLESIESQDESASFFNRESLEKLKRVKFNFKAEQSQYSTNSYLTLLAYESD